MKRETCEGRVVYFEFRHVGNSLRVAALDPHTRTEITMIADPRHSDEEIKRVAARKLFYVIDKNRAAKRRST